MPSVYDNRGYLQLPTPDTSSEDDMPSLEHDSTASSDIDWAYPPTLPPLPTLEASRVLIRPPPTIPEHPELELPAIELPLRQFEDLNVDSNAADELEKEIEQQNTDSRNIPHDVDMEPSEHHAHLPLTDRLTTTHSRSDDNPKDEANLVPPIAVLDTIPTTNQRDELAQDPANPEYTQESPSPYDHDDRWMILDHPPRTYYQGQLAAEL